MELETFPIRPPPQVRYKGDASWRFVSFDGEVRVETVDSVRHIFIDEASAWCTLTKSDDWGNPSSRTVRVRLNDPDWEQL